MNIFNLISIISGAIAVTSTAVAGASFGGAFSNSKVDVENTRNLKSIIEWSCLVINSNKDKFAEDNKSREVKHLCENLDEHIKDLRTSDIKGSELKSQISRLNNKALETAVWSALEEKCFYHEMLSIKASKFENMSFGTELGDSAQEVCKYVPKPKDYEELKKGFMDNLEKEVIQENEFQSILSSDSYEEETVGTISSDQQI
ncbi:hypothetical protein [Candidatus Mycoplasma haematohominis]|uniref:hypothetical protein n=1 Tax=Candidatus Mycoplasma haematohominis TaxID=1494318 RepID=UPI001C0A71A3|nr:hypothetical protein [Candidatus Mycoplasma haemohominis]